MDPPWLCHNVFGPLLSPDSFTTHLESSASGIANREKIQTVLKNFNKKESWGNVDNTIELLCRLEICYSLQQKDSYQFPALIKEDRPNNAWDENSEMTVYVGRRLKSENETDIITPGTMSFIQSSARTRFQPSEPVVWQGGLLIERTIDRVSVEGMIVFKNREKAIDFVVRGPKHSERQCMKHLRDLRNVGTKILHEKSPGTTQSLLYISCTELKQRKDFPAAHKSQTVEKMMTTSESSNTKVGLQDTLRDLLALPDDHFSYLPHEAFDIVCNFLDKDTEGRSELAKSLPGFSAIDRNQCKTAEQLLTRWSERLKATIKSFSDTAQQLGLLYLLAILSDSGALKLSDEMVH